MSETGEQSDIEETSRQRDESALETMNWIFYIALIVFAAGFYRAFGFDGASIAAAFGVMCRVLPIIIILWLRVLP